MAAHGSHVMFDFLHQSAWNGTQIAAGYARTAKVGGMRGPLLFHHVILIIQLLNKASLLALTVLHILHNFSGSNCKAPGLCE